MVTNMADGLYGQHRLMFNLPIEYELAVLWQVKDYRSRAGSAPGFCQICCQTRKQAPLIGTCLTKQLALEATGGFEPPNGGFANLCLRPLGYVAIASGPSVAWPVGHCPDGIPGADYLFNCGAEGGTRTRTPLRAQRPQRCLSTNSNTSAQVLARSNVWQGRRDSNPRPSVLETDALAS